jgi:hypothetical protein
MKRFAAAVLVMLAAATPAFARVLSYAPYSNRTSLASITNGPRATSR